MTDVADRTLEVLVALVHATLANRREYHHEPGRSQAVTPDA
jgi:hypothetical protein